MGKEMDVVAVRTVNNMNSKKVSHIVNLICLILITLIFLYDEVFSLFYSWSNVDITRILLLMFVYLWIILPNIIFFLILKKLKIDSRIVNWSIMVLCFIDVLLLIIGIMTADNENPLGGIIYLEIPLFFWIIFCLPILGVALLFSQRTNK